MAWEWSHSKKAYDNARSNLENLPKEELNSIYAEWLAVDGAHEIALEEHEEDKEYAEMFEPPKWDSGGFDEGSYKVALKMAETLTNDVLVNYIWGRASNYATCDNGGFDLWICSYGCHTVSCYLNEIKE